MQTNLDLFSADSANPAALQSARHHLASVVAHSAGAASLSRADARALTTAIAQGQPLDHALSAKLRSRRVRGSANPVQHLAVLGAMLELLQATEVSHG